MPPHMHPPPGRLIGIGAHRLHIRCEGAGTPAVVFDAALGASSLSWSLVQPLVARTTAACAYDRAGFGWSDAGPLPRTAGRIADELWLLLRSAAVPPPYVLVGHSFGGLVVRLFAARHPAAAAALVLIEPAHPADWARPSGEQRALIDRGVRLCGHGAVAARMGLARAVSMLVGAGALGPARALVRLLSRGGLRREDEGILAPVGRLPPEARAVLTQMWTQPKFFEALGSQIESICESAAAAEHEAGGSLGDLPLIVLSSADATEHRRASDAALARHSSRGRHVLVPDCGHWIPLDQPEAVAAAIVEVVDALRDFRPTSAPSRDSR